MMHAGEAGIHVLANSAVTTADDGWYRDITDFAQHTGWLQPIMSVYTTLGIGLLVVILVVGWWTARRAGDRAAMAAAVWTVFGTALSIGLGLGLKQVFAEARPCIALAHVTTVQPCPGPTDYSFPSDHTTVAVALAAGIYLVNRRLGIIAALLALLEGFSRVYLGQHYPHDVVAAIVLGMVVIFAGWPMVRRPLTCSCRWRDVEGARVPEDQPDRLRQPAE